MVESKRFASVAFIYTKYKGHHKSVKKCFSFINGLLMVKCTSVTINIPYNKTLVPNLSSLISMYGVQ